MTLHLCDLVDPDSVDAFLLDHLTDPVTADAKEELRALAQEALSFTEPPAGAHVLLGRLAELEGDLAAFVEHVRMAVRADPDFGPALDDQEYLGFLRTGAGRRAGAARRAELLFHKADRWSGRVPQLADQVDLAGRVLGVDDPKTHAAGPALASLWQFLQFLLFEGGLLGRFEADCGSLLSVVEREMLASWQDVRHRLIGLEEQHGRRARVVDVLTGERLDVAILHEEGDWPVGRIGLALLVPTGEQLVLIGEPVLLDDEMVRPFGTALITGDARLTDMCLQLCFAASCERMMAEHHQRVRFALPEAHPEERRPQS